MSKIAPLASLGILLSVLACASEAGSDGNDAPLGILSQRIESMNGPELVGTAPEVGQLLYVSDSVSLHHSGSTLICPSVVMDG